MQEQQAAVGGKRRRNRGGRRRGGRGGGGRGGGDAPDDEMDEVGLDESSALPAPQAAASRTAPPPMPAFAGAAAFATAAPPAARAAPHAASRTSSTTRAHMTASRFAELPISPLTKRAIAEVLGYETCTLVQAQTLPVALTGRDVIAKAKTGTGKTIAFLLPTIERLLRLTENGPRAGTAGVLAIAISPTRELAAQIGAECDLLLRFCPHLSCRVVFGGTNVKQDARNLTQRAPAVLVATPGRLNDLLYNYNLAQMAAGLTTLIFDEADQLLEMGFRPDITRILEALAPSRANRQTLLFSATLPNDVLHVAKIAAKPEAALVDTVGKEEQTHQHIEQHATVAPCECLPAELLALLGEISAASADNPAGFKVVVFFVTARLTQLYAELFQALGFPVLEMHSRKSQPHRTRVAETFRNGRDLVMFSSDVSARGMDYPDVTCVVQLGLPSDRNQYIHRIGRTARAGKGGGGFLLLADFEAGFLRQISDLPISQRAPIDAAARARLDPRLSAAVRSLPPLTLGCAYQARRPARRATNRARRSPSRVPLAQAWLGFYNSHLRFLGWSKEELVRRANAFSAQTLRLPSPPALEPKTVSKMGLKGVPGLNVERGAKEAAKHASGGGGFGGGSGGFGGGGGGGRGRYNGW